MASPSEAERLRGIGANEARDVKLFALGVDGRVTVSAALQHDEGSTPGVHFSKEFNRLKGHSDIHLHW